MPKRAKKAVLLTAEETEKTYIPVKTDRQIIYEMMSQQNVLKDKDAVYEARLDNGILTFHCNSIKTAERLVIWMKDELKKEGKLTQKGAIPFSYGYCCPREGNVEPLLPKKIPEIEEPLKEDNEVPEEQTYSYEEDGQMSLF